MADFNEDAQHPATAIRLQQALREGDAPKSHELVAAIQVIAGVAVLYFLVNGLAGTIAKFTTLVWQSNGISSDAVQANVSAVLEDLTFQLAATLLPILLTILIGSILSHLVQVGTAFGFKKPIWQPRQLNPVSGIKRLFSLDNLLRGVLGIPKVAIIGWVALLVLWNQRFDLVQLSHMRTQDLGNGMIDQIFIVLFAASGTLFAISSFDYLVQRYSFQTRMRMTDQQLRDENRLQAPDPQMKSSRAEFFERITNRESG